MYTVTLAPDEVVVMDKFASTVRDRVEERRKGNTECDTLYGEEKRLSRYK